ncbi:MAG: ECF transporter S component [Erysipelotrichaceae bacterium]|nr:ECF transporter S component [Erysipelotrichaceae bacterium]
MTNDKTKRVVTLSMFTALVIVLQVVATFVNFGGFPITLTLVPIIIAGAVYGIPVGAFMGLTFGVVVALMVVVGADPSGATLLSLHPVITISACILKGILAGAVSAAIYHGLKEKNEKLAIILAAAAAPIVNTGTLYIALILFFDATFAAMLGAFMSVNFLIELAINIIIAPSLLRVVHKKIQ